MPFEPIDSAEIAVGKAVKRELFLKVKNSLDDLDLRVAGLSAGTAPVEIFNVAISNASSASTLTGIADYESPVTQTIALAKVQIYETGGISSGSLEIDIKIGDSLDDADLTSIFTVKPIINFASAVDYEFDSGTLDNTNQILAVGKFARLDITALPGTPLGRFRVLVYGVIA